MKKKKTCKTCRYRVVFSSVCINGQSDYIAATVDPDNTCPEWAPIEDDDPEDGRYSGLISEE